MDLKVKGNTLIVPEGITNISCNDMRFVSYIKDRIKEIILPSTLVTIGCEAFSHFSNLEKINFPNSIQIIEDAAFSFCKSLKHIELNEGLKRICIDAFYSCDLEELYIPSTVNYIDSPIALNNKNLKKIIISEDNPYYSDMGCNVIYNKDLKALIQGCNSSIIPEAAELLSNRAFAYCNLEKIVLPENLVYINDNLFYNAKIKTVYAKNPKINGTTAFLYCDCLNAKYVKNIDKESTLYKLFKRKIKSFNIETLIQEGSSIKEINQIYKGLNIEDESR